MGVRKFQRKVEGELYFIRTNSDLLAKEGGGGGGGGGGLELELYLRSKTRKCGQT